MSSPNNCGDLFTLRPDLVITVSLTFELLFGEMFQADFYNDQICDWHLKCITCLYAKPIFLLTNINQPFSADLMSRLVGQVFSGPQKIWERISFGGSVWRWAGLWGRVYVMQSVQVTGWLSIRFWHPLSCFLFQLRNHHWLQSPDKTKRNVLITAWRGKNFCTCTRQLKKTFFNLKTRKTSSVIKHICQFSFFLKWSCSKN